MSLTGFSLGMNIFHFEAFPLYALKFRFQVTNLHIFGSLERSWPKNGSYCIFDYGLGLWPAPDSKESPKMYNFCHDPSIDQKFCPDNDPSKISRGLKKGLSIDF
jgi:hypothetical protein